MASAVDGARLVNASRDAPATSVTDAASLLQARSRQLESLEGRLRQAFGNDGSNAASANGTSDLPPPIPSTQDGASTTSSRQRPGGPSAAARTPSAGGTPNARRLELRQTRNSPGGHHISYSIDPDFNMESDSDSGSDEGGASNDYEDGDGEADPTDASVNRLSRRTLSSGLAPSAQQPQPSTESSARAGDYERAAALRDLLRFGSAGGIHAMERSNRDSRQQMREIRLRERAEEEQALNRAILMSLQENQSADRRRSGAGNIATSASTAEAAGAGTAEGSDEPAPVSSEPAESDVVMLESMGFTREQVTQALIENRMNVELAANRLLGIDF